MTRSIAFLCLLSIPFLTPTTAESQLRFSEPAPIHGLYSDAIAVGDLVFLSGIIAPHEDPEAQFRNVFGRMGRILESLDSGLDLVVDMTTFHVDMHEHIGSFTQVKNEFMDHLPTWTAVGVTELFEPAAYIEVKVVAAVRDAR